MFLIAGLMLVPMALAGDASAGAARATSGGTHVYTNADLAKYATEKDDVVTNSKLKAPLPTQRAPIAESPEGWDFVFRMLDREREQAAIDRQAADNAAQAAAQGAEPEPTYYYPFNPYGFFGGGRRGGNPYPHRPNLPQVPTDTNRPLDERGVFTAHDLFNEAERNQQIQRQNLIHHGNGFGTVHPH
jgi:hypothetical protein